jgi:hypothetical protein
MKTYIQFIPQISNLKKWLLSLLPTIPVEMPQAQIPQEMPLPQVELMPLGYQYVMPDGGWSYAIPFLIPAGMPMTSGW